jgi:two-component system chemotaxis response regulator CheY
MRRVLIVDDSKMARMFIKRTLQMVMTEEAEFEQAVDGRDALDKMKKASFDLLVTDLNMPNMDGAQLLKRVIASPRLHGTPSIVITSLKNPAKEAELKSYGVSAILGKPLDSAALSEAIDKVFGKDKENDGYIW